MKVYLVWATRHDLIHSTNVLKGIFLSKEKAQARLDELNKANSDPLEEDLYGPVRGTTFSLFENEVEE